MHPRKNHLRPLAMAALAFTACLALLAPGAARADTLYKIQPIVKRGDMVGDVLIPPNYQLGVEALNDNGQILLLVPNLSWERRLLFQYADGKITPIALPNGVAPSGKWPNGLIVRRPLTMNQQGNVVFCANVTIAGQTSWGTFLWSYKDQHVTALALKGMPAVQDRIFAEGGAPVPVINNVGEIALTAEFKSSHAQDPGILFRTGNGELQPVALPDQDLPGGGKLHWAAFPTINDASVVAFPGRRFGRDKASGYLWEKGVLTPLLQPGQDAPGGGVIDQVTGTGVGNRNILIWATLCGSSREVTFLSVAGKLTRFGVPGQAMPGGGKLKEILGFSRGNEAGQRAFLARLEDGTKAIYRMEPDGQLSLLLASGATTDQGKVTFFGGSSDTVYGLALNNKGQLALPVSLDGGPATVVILTPTSP